MVPPLEVRLAVRASSCDDDSCGLAMHRGASLELFDTVITATGCDSDPPGGAVGLGSVWDQDKHEGAPSALVLRGASAVIAGDCVRTAVLVKEHAQVFVIEKSQIEATDAEMGVGVLVEGNACADGGKYPRVLVDDGSGVAAPKGRPAVAVHTGPLPRRSPAGLGTPTRGKRQSKRVAKLAKVHEKDIENSRKTFERAVADGLLCTTALANVADPVQVAAFVDEFRTLVKDRFPCHEKYGSDLPSDFEDDGFTSSADDY
jgi:hypothetical protein